MSKEELELFFIDYASIILQAEFISFCKHFHLEDVSIDYELEDNVSKIYLNDKGERTLVGTMDYKAAVMSMRHVGDFIDDIFDGIVKKYNLVTTPVIETVKEGSED